MTDPRADPPATPCDDHPTPLSKESLWPPSETGTDQDRLPPPPPTQCEASPLAAALGVPRAAPRAIGPPPVIPGYEILGELGRGGMGVVYKARQVGLQRLVALKMIRADSGAYPEQTARFLNEAHIVAAMRHANIIQIHEIGECRGQTYLSLEFVEGGSLDRKLNGTPIAVGEATRLVETLARAMQAAHAQGVIHRDLKPANVLLTGDGTPKITDFGLAKRLDQAGGQTQSGAVLGTPSYMAPEQAGGRPREVGPASDVYALGALLYECLTGRPPFLAATSMDTLMLVLTEEPVAPRRLNPQVPRDVETICLKCLSKEPGRRYASAAALAEDLRRWQAGEPILARPVGALERGWKWARKRPAVVSLLALLALGVAAAIVALRAEQARTARERDQALDNLERALEAEREAKDNFRQAQQAVDECFGLAKDDRLLQGENLRKVRQQLLRKTLPFYRSFTEKSPEDEALLAQQADYLYRVAYITSEIDRKADALKHFEQARDIQLRLSQSRPEAPRYQADLAATCNDLGLLLFEMGKGQQAEKSFIQARDARLRLSQAHPEDVRYQADLAATCNDLGTLQSQTGKPLEAEKSFVQARDIGLRLSQARPQVPRYQVNLATTLMNLGIIQWGTGKRLEALQSYQRARDIQAELIKAHPGVAAYQVALGRTCVNLGNLLSRTGSPQEALQSYEQARDILLRLSQAHPEVTKYQADLATTLMNLGVTQRGTGKPQEALQSYQRARDILLRLTRANPEVTEHQIDLAGVLTNLGNLQRQTGQPQEALKAAGESIALLLAVGKRDPRYSDHRLFLRNAHLSRALTLGQLGRPGEAVGDWEEALRLNPIAADTAYFHQSLAESLVRAGDYTRAVSKADELAGGLSLSGATLYNLACVNSLAAAALARDDRRPLPLRDKLAERWARHAVELLGRAAEAGHFQVTTNRAHLDSDSDLGFLRGRDDFRALVQSLPSAR